MTFVDIAFIVPERLRRSVTATGSGFICRASICVKTILLGPYRSLLALCGYLTNRIHTAKTRVLYGNHEKG